MAKQQTLSNGQTGQIHGVINLLKFIQQNDLTAKFRGDLVVVTPRIEQPEMIDPQPEPSVVEFARSLAEASPAEASTETAIAADMGELPITLGKPVRLYADGGCVTDPVSKQFNPSPIGGTWAWCWVDENDQRINGASGFISVAESQMDKGVTNNLTELLAIVRGLESLPSDWVGTVCSDSKISLGRVFESNRLSEIPAWLIRRLGEVLRNHKMSEIKYILHDGHPTAAQLTAGTGKRGHPVSIHNVWCDEACQEAGKAALKGLGLA